MYASPIVLIFSSPCFSACALLRLQAPCDFFRKDVAEEFFGFAALHLDHAPLKKIGTHAPLDHEAGEHPDHVRRYEEKIVVQQDHVRRRLHDDRDPFVCPEAKETGHRGVDDLQLEQRVRHERDEE
jgi:hypothetical protein